MENQLTAMIFGGVIEAFKGFWWVAPLLLVIAFLKSPLFKGWFGEKAVKARLNSLNAEIYRPFHDLIVPLRGSTTQIDHIYVSPFGIFVLETKNYTGWIYGGGQQAKWTQVVYRKKHSFQNPLRQNYAHIKALSALLNLPESVFHSVVVFLGDCEFKTPMPENVKYIGQAERYIQSFQTALLSDEEIRRICALLQRPEYTAGRAARELHKNNLRQRHGSR